MRGLNREKKPLLVTIKLGKCKQVGMVKITKSVIKIVSFNK